jgi:hypothetical protein
VGGGRSGIGILTAPSTPLIRASHSRPNWAFRPHRGPFSGWPAQARTKPQATRPVLLRQIQEVLWTPSNFRKVQINP